MNRHGLAMTLGAAALAAILVSCGSPTSSAPPTTSPSPASPSASPTATTGLPVAGTEVARVAVDTQPDGLTFGLGSLWVGHYGSNGIERLDPATGRVTATIDTGLRPIQVATAAS